MKLKRLCRIGLIVLIPAIGMVISCQSDEEIEFKRCYSSGSLTYQTHCQNCHGANGEGLQGLIPLTDSVFLKSDKARLACFIKYGLKGKVTISNRVFEGTMPANDLPPIEIANVLTYITNSFSNKAGIFSPDMAEKDLKKCE